MNGKWYTRYQNLKNVIETVLKEKYRAQNVF